ncbi:membrane-fusion domain protein, partial [Vibrio parahaemolyticus AQ3810]
STGCR